MTQQRKPGKLTVAEVPGTSSQLQEAIESTINPPRYYNESSRHTAIIKKLAIFIGATNVPFSWYDSEEFRDLLQEMDRNIKYLIKKKFVSKIYNHKQETIWSLLNEAVIVSVCAIFVQNQV